MAKVCRNEFIGDTVEIARRLLGCYLVRIWHGEMLVCRITETEAYVGSIDKACHAYGYRKTPRNAVMFGPPGHAYVYLIYGMYHCLNFTTNIEGEPEAVLLRGLSPVYGQERMAHLRYGKPLAELTSYQKKHFLNGPGKCCKALDIDRSLNGEDLTGDTLFICHSLADLGLPEENINLTIHCGKRIGIDYAAEAVDFPWRFWTEESTC